MKGRVKSIQRLALVLASGPARSRSGRIFGTLIATIKGALKFDAPLGLYPIHLEHGDTHEEDHESCGKPGLQTE
jgi:hypothetical protein